MGIAVTAYFIIYWYYFYNTNFHKFVIVFQSNEVSNSYQMEAEGLKRALRQLGDDDLHVAQIITDRHPQITKNLRVYHPHIKHYFDCWHMAKGAWHHYIDLFVKYGC